MTDIQRASFEAIRWNGTDVEEIDTFVGASCRRVADVLVVPREDGGALLLVAGAWLVRTAEGLRVLDDADHDPPRADHLAATEEVAEVLAFDGGFD